MLSLALHVFFSLALPCDVLLNVDSRFCAVLTNLDHGL